jgi:hypothetical protein
MIGTVLDLIIGPLGAALGAVIAVALAYFRGKSAGKKGAEHDAMQDTFDRLEKGRDAVRDGRGHDPADRLRKNDQRW